MKKLGLFALAAAGMLAFTACEDDNAKPQAFLMQVNQPSGAFASLEVNSLLPIEIAATSNKGIVGFSGSVTFDDSTYTLFENTVDTTTDFLFVDTVLIPSAQTNIVYKYTAMDVDSATVSRSITVSLTNRFGETQNGQVWNIQGPNTGAWDLVGDSAVSASADSTIKDIIDDTQAGLGVTYDATWVSGNGTTFVLDNNLTFASNLTEIIAAYEAGTELENTGTLATGDIVICKNARFPKGYVLIEVTNVEDTSILDNLDNIEFIYKK